MHRIALAGQVSRLSEQVMNIRLFFEEFDVFDQMVVLFGVVWLIGDVGTSILAAYYVGIDNEINPLLRWAFEIHHGIGVGLMTVATLFAVWLLVRGKPHIKAVRGWFIWLTSVILIGSVIMVWNLLMVALVTTS